MSYAYDVQDHLTQITDGEGGVTTYVYSDRDLLTQETSEVSGATVHTYNEHGESHQPYRCSWRDDDARRRRPGPGDL